MHIPGNRIVVAPTSEDRLVTAMPGTEDVEFDIATLPPPHGKSSIFHLAVSRVLCRLGDDDDGWTLLSASREIVELEDRKNEGHDDVSEAGGKASIHVGRFIIIHFDSCLNYLTNWLNFVRQRQRYS